MNRHDLGWRQHLAFRWSCRRTVSDDLKNGAATIAALLGILAAYGIVGALDYEDALRTEAQAAAMRATTLNATLAECLDGRAVFLTEDKKTAIVCRKAEEFPI